jgi:hypothetical protein
MKRILVITAFIIGAIFFVYILLRLIWSFEEKKILNIYILDKTVTRFDRPEHKAFTWILNQNRYVMPDRNNYSSTKDYYGFFPIDIDGEVFDFKSLRINEVDVYADVFDIAYYTDCYGVHSFEWYKGKTKPIRSQKVYGGLNQNDYLLIKKMIDNGKLVLGEYSMFSTPTNALVRSKTEAALGITWTNWSGKCFSTLDVDVEGGPPEWMKNLYESQHMGVWPAKKEGIVLISNDGAIELLVQGEHLNSSVPAIITQPDIASRFGVSQKVLFEQWFEFILPGQNNVVSNFEFDLTPKGQELFTKLGLNPIPPAVIGQSGNEHFFYFCGDFADNPVVMWTAKIAGGEMINHLLFRNKAGNRAVFFKNYYAPLIRNILDEYYKSLDKAKKEKS